MSTNLSILFEISFDIFYLLVIWALVILMYKKTTNLTSENKLVGNILKTGFLLLAIGDTGHVGFRVWAYALGNINAKVNLFGLNITMVGIGACATAYTITLLYMLILKAWKIRFNKKAAIIYYLLMLTGVFRLIIMLLPQNDWGAVIPPLDFSLIRNVPLMIMGIGAAVLILIDASKNKDKIFKIFGYLILVSYLFYTPVILFIQKAPMLGMLMIPKTIAYMLMAYYTYKYFFKRKCI